jgi:hypothetical protein
MLRKSESYVTGNRKDFKQNKVERTEKQKWGRGGDT